MAVEKKVEIEMKDGSKKLLSELTNNDLPDVKLSSNDKGETNLALKHVTLNETTAYKTERRIYKWRTMPAVAMYNVAYGRTLAILSKDLGDTNVYEYAIGNYLIEQDKVHNGVVSGRPLDERIIMGIDKLGLPKSDADKIKAIMKAHGFGK